MFYDESRLCYVEDTFSACAAKLGEKRLIRGAGPWSAVRVVVFKVEDLGNGRSRVFAKEVD